jgi:hypothetical protein
MESEAGKNGTTAKTTALAPVQAKGIDRRVRVGRQLLGRAAHGEGDGLVVACARGVPQQHP